MNGGDLVCVGRRFDYTIVQPIVDRSVTPPANRPLIFNFYPGVGSSDTPILTGLVESDVRFFGRAEPWLTTSLASWPRNWVLPSSRSSTPRRRQAR